MFDEIRTGRWWKWFAPPSGEKCLTCDRHFSSEEAACTPVCASCLQAVPWIRHIRCGVCGRPENCPDCRRRKRKYFVIQRSAVRYTPLMKEWLARYKYTGDERMEAWLGRMMLFGFERLRVDMAAVIKGSGNAEPGLNPAAPELDAVTWVPLEPGRMQERGFNQAERLARFLAREARLAAVPLLGKYETGEKQSQKSRMRRIREVRDTFYVRRQAREHFRQQGVRVPPFMTNSGTRHRLLLVDDVYTTGSTVNECARVLREVLPCEVWVLTWARS